MSESEDLEKASGKNLEDTQDIAIKPTADETSENEEKTVTAIESKPTVSAPVRPGGIVRYMNRRSTHSSRAVITVISLLIAIAAAIFLVVERIVDLSGHHAIFTPRNLLDVFTQGIYKFPQWTVWLGAGIAIVLGLLLLGKALFPGSLRRHAIADERISVIADDAAIAAGISRRIREFAGLQRGQVRTGVERKRITVKITPTSGNPLNLEELLRVANAEVDSYQPLPRPKVRVKISQQGVIEP